MRDLDQKQRIVGDFICVYGDVVAQIPLGPALAAHRARREKDKKAIMSMVLREAGSASHRTKAQLLRPTFVIDPARQRCVHYEQVRASGSGLRVDIPAESLAEAEELEVRQDLIDCGIDICTPEVLAQYTDNFDWQQPRRGFLYGVLKDYETNQLTIHNHVLTEGYAARVKNLRLYDAISRDVLSRWTYPLTPDANMLDDQTFRLQGSIYREEGVMLARTCTVASRTVLGGGTTVGDGSVISGSVIGKRCVIGKRVTITNAYVWDDAHIDDDTVVLKSIIANNAVVGRRCRVHSGALISYGVHIADDIEVAGKRISRLKRKRGYHRNELIRGSTDSKIVWQGGEGFEAAFSDDEDDAVETLLSDNGAVADTLALSDESMSALGSEDEEDDRDDLRDRRPSNRSGSFASVGSEESGGARRAAADFHHEATASIVDAVQNGEDPDTIQLELQGLKLSSNAKDKQIRRAVTVALVKCIAALVETGTPLKDAVEKIVPPNKLLIERCVATGRADYAEQVEFLLLLQTELASRRSGDKILLFISNVLATRDLVEAEGFEAWWNDARSSATDTLQKARLETKQLVDVLVGEDDDEDEDDEGDDDEDDSDDD